jgi:hypothetical protein
MRTEKQIEASSLNGAKSRGPVTDAGKRISAANSAFSTGPRTPEGKARAAGNARKRQLLANSVALPAERNEAFLELLHDFRQSLRPVGFLEERVVENITTADWHRGRYWIIGMTKVAHATELQTQSCDDSTHSFSRERGATQTAMAISNLVDNGRSLEFFRRCEAGYSREYRHACKELKELQADRRKEEQAILDEGGDSTDFECYFDSEFPHPHSAKKLPSKPNLMSPLGASALMSPLGASAPVRPVLPQKKSRYRVNPP